MWKNLRKTLKGTIKLKINDLNWKKNMFVNFLGYVRLERIFYQLFWTRNEYFWRVREASSVPCTNDCVCFFNSLIRYDLTANLAKQMRLMIDFDGVS